MTCDLLNILNPEFGDRIVDPFRYTFIKKNRRGPYGFLNTISLTSNNNSIFLTSRRFSKDPLTEEQVQYYISEARFLLNLSHPFVVQYYCFTYKLPFSFITKNTHISTLYDRINKRAFKKPLSGSEKSIIVICIASSMMYLHSMNIVNYDLSSENIYLYDNDYPKLGNFSSHPYSDYFPNYNQINKIENNQWTPPELYDDEDDFMSPKTDVYSFGIILWELLTEQCPYSDINPSEYEFRIKKNCERPKIPEETPKHLKKLIELCWSSDPEERPSFHKIYELFTSKKVLFPNTDINLLAKAAAVSDEWMKTHGPKKKDFRNVSDIPNFFRISTLKEILEYTSSLDETNCQPFFEGVNELLKDDSDERKFTGLFEILQLITLNPKCVQIYIQTNHIQNLPFLNEYYSELCLSILIPIFSVSPSSLTPSLFKILETLTSQYSIKVIRLISVYASNKLDVETYRKLLDFLLIQSNLLIQNNASFPLIHTVYKLIKSAPKLLEIRGQFIIRLFSTCLSSSSNDCIISTYNALIMLRPQIIPVECDVFCRHLEDHMIRPKTLQLLCFTRPVKITQRLIEFILKETKRAKLAQNAILMLSRHNDVSQILLAKPSIWMAPGLVSIETSLKIVLILMQQNANRQQLVKCNQIFANLLNQAIDKTQLSVIDALYSTVRNLPANPDFITALSNSGFISNFLKIANDSDNEGVQLRGYYLVDYLGRIKFVTDYLIFLPRVKLDLFHNEKMKTCALTYCSVINLDQRGRQALIQNNMLQMLSNIQH